MEIKYGRYEKEARALLSKVRWDAGDPKALKGRRPRS